MASLSLDQARRLALGAQGLCGTRPVGNIDRRHLLGTMRRIELLQLDSVPAVIRTQYMPLFSRLGVYRPALLDQIAYTEDEWFEAWSHEASLLPVQTEPLLRWRKARAAAGGAYKGLVKLAREEPLYVHAVRDEVAARGPLAASQLADPRPRNGQWWASRSMGHQALDWLFQTGQVGIRRSKNFEKQFDLLERIVPAQIRALPTPAEPDALKALLVRAAKAHGVGTADDLVDYFRLPKRDAKALLPELVEEGKLVATEVETWSRPAFRHPDARLPRKPSWSTLLSPFDPVVWFRDRAQRLFDFRYRIEIYTPAERRTYGYYVLPLLHEGRLVGRFDLKTLRAEGVLHVKGAYLEPGLDATSVAEPAHRELSRLATFVGATKLRIERRGNLARALRRVGTAGLSVGAREQPVARELRAPATDAHDP